MGHDKGIGNKDYDNKYDNKATKALDVTITLAESLKMVRDDYIGNHSIVNGKWVTVAFLLGPTKHGSLGVSSIIHVEEHIHPRFVAGEIGA